jgi:hypothetical protein
MAFGVTGKRHFFAFSPSSRGRRSFFLAARRSLLACSLAELVSRLSAALMNVHDLPAAIKPRSRLFSSDVQRILGMTRSFSSPEPEFDQAADGLSPSQLFSLRSNPLIDGGKFSSVPALADLYALASSRWPAAPFFCGNPN